MAIRTRPLRVFGVRPAWAAIPALALLTLAGCGGGGEVGGGTGAPPVIYAFQATPPAITAGGTSTLSWSVTGAATLAIDQGIGPVTGLATWSVSPAGTTTYTLTAANAGGSVSSPVTVTVSPAAEIPLTTRAHMDAATQAVYDRIRARQAWLLGVDALGTAANASLTVPAAQVQARWTELYGPGAGLPACVEWEMAERNSPAAHRDWSGLNAFAAAGGLPWIMASMNNFTVSFAPGTPPQGGMNDTRNRAAGVLPGGSGNAAFTAYVRQLAREIKAVGRPVVFRPFHEGNGGWFWWGGNAANFKELWKLTFDLFRDEGAANVIWLWAASDICNGTVCTATAYYPGDSLVDMLGVDLYFTGPALPASAVNTLAALEAIGPDKPIVIGELGPAARADFWGQAANAFAGVKRFRGFSLWFARGWNAWGGGPGAGSLIDGSTDDATRAAFSAFLADPRVLTLRGWGGL